MKARAIVLALALCFVAAAVCFAADGFMGTWKLNEAKSKIAPGAPKNSTVVYEAAGDNVKVTIDGTDYPVTGGPSVDMRSAKKVNDHSLTATQKKDGKVTTIARIVLSPDGKTRTVTASGTDAKGNKISSTAIYDKQ